MKYNFTIPLALMLLLSLNNSLAQTKTSPKVVKPVQTTKLELTKDELDKKDAVHAYSKKLTDEDKNTQSVHYFEFKNFDQPMSIRFILHLMDDKSILKFCPSNTSFALVTAMDFSEIKLQEYAQSLGLSLKTITSEEYSADTQKIK